MNRKRGSSWGALLLLAAGLAMAACGQQPASNPTERLVGRLRLVREERRARPGEMPKRELFYLQKGQPGPQPVAEPGWEEPEIEGRRVVARSADKRYYLLEPHLLLDSATGVTTPLPAPGIAELDPDYNVGRGHWAPDGRHAAYVASSPRQRMRILFIADLEPLRATPIHESYCRQYQGSVIVTCESITLIGWIDSDTFMFAYHEGLPPSYKPGTAEDPSRDTNLAVVDTQGEQILSTESGFSSYRMVQGTVFRCEPYSGTCSAWLAGSDLAQGVFAPHPLPVPTASGVGAYAGYGAMAMTISPDGRKILVAERKEWRVYDLQTGVETALGTDFDSYDLGNRLAEQCLWSPDGSQVACFMRSTRSDKRKKDDLVIIPLSGDKQWVLLSAPQDQEDPYVWSLFDWLP